MVPCKNTIKVVNDGYIEETLVRDALRAAQTPQVFKTDLYLSCVEKAKQGSKEVLIPSGQKGHAEKSVQTRTARPAMEKWETGIDIYTLL